MIIIILNLKTPAAAGLKDFWADNHWPGFDR